MTSNELGRLLFDVVVILVVIAVVFVVLSMASGCGSDLRADTALTTNLEAALARIDELTVAMVRLEDLVVTGVDASNRPTHTGAGDQTINDPWIGRIAIIAAGVTVLAFGIYTAGRRFKLIRYLIAGLKGEACK